MTMCEIRFRSPALNEAQLASLEQLRGQLYGLRGFSEEDGQLVVTYDASRLSPAVVETALHRAGIPVQI
jgi:hypothetical protein